MSTHRHRIRSTWPLYLVIAIAGAASIATSPPPSWHVALPLEGPPVTLDPDRREHTAPFTIRFSPKQDWSEISVMGAIEYQDAAEELRISLVEPGQRTLDTHFRTVEGDGRLLFRLDAQDVSLRCEPSGPDACEQELAVVFGTGGTRSGSYFIQWYLQVRTGGDGSTPPADLIYEAEVTGGRPVDEIPSLLGLFVPGDEPGDGRWRLVADDQALFYLDPAQAAPPLHFVVRGAGPFTASELVIPFSVDHAAPSAEDGVDFRLAIVPDDPAASAGVEYAATVAGADELVDVLSIPAPLDCAGAPVCERGFTITVESDDEDFNYLTLLLHTHALLDGEGNEVPVGAFVEIIPDPVVEPAAQDD